HCRKCGDVVCAPCASRQQLLIDLSNTDIVYLKVGTKLASLNSENSPVRPYTVCDDCFDQIEGSNVP
ncbi:hypothetical protein B0H14DRAFT_2220318, partial [Mycena olivaceomarginata]